MFWMYKECPQLIQLHLYAELFSKDFSSLFKCRTNAVDLLAEVVVTIGKSLFNNSINKCSYIN